MKILLIIMTLIAAASAVDLPRTLAGVAPAEDIEAYLGTLGFPSMLVPTEDSKLYSWGDGLLIRTDEEGIVEQVIITRVGRQKELGFDVGDNVSAALSFLSEQSPNHNTFRWLDEATGLSLMVTTDESDVITNITLNR